MKWDEFADLISGLSADTPLGRIVSIRAEDDPEALKYFTKGQMKIRNEWRRRMASQMSQDKVEDFVEQMKNALIAMAGGRSEKKD